MTAFEPVKKRGWPKGKPRGPRAVKKSKDPIDFFKDGVTVEKIKLFEDEVKNIMNELAWLMCKLGFYKKQMEKIPRRIK